MSDLSPLPDFQRTQYQFAAHLRDPENCLAPGIARHKSIEDRRLRIYQELIFNNLFNFIKSGFPVLSGILGEERLRRLTRKFLSDYRCQSPYFLEISQEFLRFLQESYKAEEGDPVFLLELAHYEWVELALDVAEEELPPEVEAIEVTQKNILTLHFQVSPLAWSLSYSYPVHRISQDFQPRQASDEASFLVVYRNRKDQVGFLEINAVTARLMQFMGSGEFSGTQALDLVASELEHPDPGVIQNFGATILIRLYQEDIIFPLAA